MRGQAGAGVVVRMAPVLTMSSLACRLGWVRSDVRRCSESHRTRESRRAGCLVEVANSQGKRAGKGESWDAQRERWRRSSAAARRAADESWHSWHMVSGS